MGQNPKIVEGKKLEVNLIDAVEHDITIKERQIIHTFQAPPDIMKLNERIVEIIHEEDGKGVGTSDTINANVSLFTGWKTFEPEEFQILMEWGGACIQEVSRSRFSIEILPIYTHCWGMKYNDGDCTPAHGHFPSLWSWTYYPKVDDNTSPLQICSSLEGLEKTERLDSKRFDQNPALSITPKTGQLVLFQSHIYHQVPLVEGQYDRYCVAANASHDLWRDDQPF